MSKPTALNEELIKAKSGEFDISLILRLDLSMLGWLSSMFYNVFMCATGLIGIASLNTATELVDLCVSNNQVHNSTMPVSWLPPHQA